MGRPGIEQESQPCLAEDIIQSTWIVKEYLSRCELDEPDRPASQMSINQLSRPSSRTRVRTPTPVRSPVRESSLTPIWIPLNGSVEDSSSSNSTPRSNEPKPHHCHHFPSFLHTIEEHPTSPKSESKQHKSKGQKTSSSTSQASKVSRDSSTSRASNVSRVSDASRSSNVSVDSNVSHASVNQDSASWATTQETEEGDHASVFKPVAKGDGEQVKKKLVPKKGPLTLTKTVSREKREEHVKRTSEEHVKRTSSSTYHQKCVQPKTESQEDEVEHGR